MKLNIGEACTEYPVYLNKINDPKVLTEIEEEYGGDMENGVAYLFGDTIEELHIPEEAVRWESGEFHEDMCCDMLWNWCGQWSHYLVFASGVRWNGASGYKICDDIGKVLDRSYDCDFYFVKADNAKCLSMIEGSHDSPMGAPCTVIGLTSEEYEYLNNDERTFDDIEKFVRENGIE